MKTVGIALALALLAGQGLVYALDSLKGDFESTLNQRVSMIDEYAR